VIDWLHNHGYISVKNLEYKKEILRLKDREKYLRCMLEDEKRKREEDRNEKEGMGDGHL